jgi:hypothetical protein
MELMNDLFDNDWENKDEVTIDHCLDLTLPVSILYLSSLDFLINSE